MMDPMCRYQGKECPLQIAHWGKTLLNPVKNNTNNNIVHSLFANVFEYINCGKFDSTQYLLVDKFSRATFTIKAL